MRIELIKVVENLLTASETMLVSIEVRIDIMTSDNYKSMTVDNYSFCYDGTWKNEMTQDHFDKDGNVIDSHIFYQHEGENLQDGLSTLSAAIVSATGDYPEERSRALLGVTDSDGAYTAIAVF